MTASDFNLRFRTGTPTDTPTLYTLVNAAFKSDTTTQIWLTPTRVEVFSLSYLESKAAAPDTICLIALSRPPNSTAIPTTVDGPDDRIVGCCYLRCDDAAGRAWLGTLAVDPELHARGLGRALLERAERFVVAEWGLRRMELDVVSSRVQLMAWYEKAGYVKMGTEKPFPYEMHTEGMYREGLSLVDVGKDLEVGEVGTD